MVVRRKRNGRDVRQSESGRPRSAGDNNLPAGRRTTSGAITCELVEGPARLPYCPSSLNMARSSRPRCIDARYTSSYVLDEAPEQTVYRIRAINSLVDVAPRSPWITRTMRARHSDDFRRRDSDRCHRWSLAIFINFWCGMRCLLPLIARVSYLR